MRYHHAFARSFNEMLANDPAQVSLCAETLRKMNDTEFSQGFKDIFVQSHDNSPYSLSDAWIFAQLVSEMALGNLKICKIELGEEPDADVEEASNNTKLQRLPEPFTGNFRGGGGLDNDGKICWDSQVTWQSVTWAPGEAELEVGVTKAVTTWRHLRLAQFLARWPYRSTAIYMLNWTRSAYTHILNTRLPAFSSNKPSK